MGMWITGAGWQDIRGSSGRGLSVLAGRFGVDTRSDFCVATPTILSPSWLFFDPEDKGTVILGNFRSNLPCS